MRLLKALSSASQRNVTDAIIGLYVTRERPAKELRAHAAIAQVILAGLEVGGSDVASRRGQVRLRRTWPCADVPIAKGGVSEAVAKRVPEKCEREQLQSHLWSRNPDCEMSFAHRRLR